MITMESILQNLPDINKRKRAAEQLRKVQAGFDTMAAYETPAREAPGMGGLFQVVQGPQSKKAEILNRMVGAFGSGITGGMANRREEDLANVVNPEIIRTAQMIGGGGDEPNRNALQAYSRILGGEGSAGGMQAPRIQSTKVDSEGNVIFNMSDGTKIPAGYKAERKGKHWIDPTTGEHLMIGSGSDVYGKATPVMAGGQPEQLYGVFDDEGQPIVDVNGDVFRIPGGVTQEQQQGIIRYAMGLPDDAALPGYSLGAPTPGPATPQTPLRTTPEAQQAGAVAGATARGRILAETGLAPEVAESERRIAEARERGKQQGTDLASLPSLESEREIGVGLVDELLGHKGLAKITSGWTNWVPPGAAERLVLPLALQGDLDAADAFARLEQIRGVNFLSAFKTLKGGGQITEVEGAKAEQAKARLMRQVGTKNFEQALREFRQQIIDSVEAIRKSAGAGPSPNDAPAPRGLPSGWTVEIE